MAAWLKYQVDHQNEETGTGNDAIQKFSIERIGTIDTAITMEQLIPNDEEMEWAKGPPLDHSN